MSRVVDFDAFRAERNDEPVVLRLGGRDWTLPSRLPAALALDLVRMQHEKGPDAEFDEEDVMQLGASLFGGAARFREMLAEGAVTIEEMPDLVQMVLQAYGTVPAPNREARRRRARTPSL